MLDTQEKTEPPITPKKTRPPTEPKTTQEDPKSPTTSKKTKSKTNQLLKIEIVLKKLKHTDGKMFASTL